MLTIKDALFWGPLILIGIALLELCVLHKLKRAWDWRESLNSIVISFGQRFTRVGGTALYGGLFLWTWEHRWFTIPLDTLWGITLLFFLQEFFYYWEHRFSHESRWFWASHVVHHSPNHLNLSAAYRLSWTAPFTGQSLIFLPMVWLGFHPVAVFAMVGFNLVYQFWIHTELVPRLGWFDRIFNSPSNHRVHHASNLAYLDANYGGVLIIFDRIFGTWVPETEACQFGLVKPQTSNNPLRVQFDEWRALMHDLYHAKDWRTRINFLWRAPGWQPDGRGQTTAELKAQSRALSQAALPPTAHPQPVQPTAAVWRNHQPE